LVKNAAKAAAAMQNFTLVSEHNAAMILDYVASEKESDLLRLLGSDIPTQSLERAVLLSMYYQSERYFRSAGGIETRLTAAIRRNDRAAAWFEIRYGSNGWTPGNSILADAYGIAKRRYAESELFGLYGSSTTAQNISSSDALNVYTQYTTRRSRVLEYETLFGAGAGSTPHNEILQAESDYAHSDYANQAPPINLDVRTLEESLDIAFHRLIDEYAPGRATDINPLDVLVGSEIADTLRARGRNGYVLDALATSTTLPYLLLGEGGSDAIYGSNGADVLVGGLGNDRLMGGSGSDTYRFYSGDGQDDIYDSIGDGFGGDGQGAIVIDGVTLQGTFNQVDPTNHPGLYGNGTWNLEFSARTGNVGTLTITSAAGGSDRITLHNYQSGDLGILLGPTQSRNLPTLPANTTQEATTWYDLSHLVNVVYAVGQGIANAIGNFGELFSIGVLLGNEFANRLHNGEGDDELYGYGGKDTLIATGGNDQLFGGTEDDALSGGNDDDYLQGDEGNDVLAGGLGSDVLVGGDGADYLLGGASLVATYWDWTVSFSPDGYIVNFQQFNGSPSLLGDASDELRGGSGNDYLWGGEGDDLLYGESDNDQLSGDAGGDYLFGGTGDDLLIGDGSQSSNPYVFLDPQYHGNDYLDGGEGNDHLVGDGGSDELYGGAGNDVLTGDAAGIPIEYQGDDLLDGGAGDDVLNGYGKNDTLFGGDGNDTLIGDSSDIADADHGDDYLDGGAGIDTLIGGGGADTLYGGDGDDTLGGDADNVASDFHGDDYLDGGAGNDYLRGYGGNDTLLGGAGDDELHGEVGDDVLVGGAGVDSLDGGAGDDTYVFETGDATRNGQNESDTISDSEGTNIIQIEGITSTGVTLELSANGQALVINYGNNEGIAVTLGSTVNFSLDDGEFTFAELVGALDDGTLAFSSGSWTYRVGDSADNLLAATGSTTVSGGHGNDTLTGTGGLNTYLYSVGDGTDTIADTSAKFDALGAPIPNTLRFGSWLTVDDIELSYEGESLVLSVGWDPNDQIRIQGFNPGDVLGTHPIDQFEFSNGTVLTYADLMARGFDLTGTSGNDTILGTSVDDRIDGGAGNDSLAGGSGSDTYYWGNGSGQDFIDNSDASGPKTDTLWIGGGLAPEDLAFVRSGNRKLPRQGDSSELEFLATSAYSLGVRSPSASWGRSSLYSSSHQ